MEKFNVIYMAYLVADIFSNKANELIRILFYLSNRPNEKRPKLNTISNKYTGPGSLYLELKTESNIYTIGEEEVPSLVTPKTEILAVGPYISYT